MAFSASSRPRGDANAPSSLGPFRQTGETLDGLGVALCLFDGEDKCLYWNQTFLVFFPEHAGHVYEGEPYRENLRRFYECRLHAREIPLIDSYIDAGLARHHAQTRPYVFEHHDRRLLVSSHSLDDGGRLRIWRATLADHFDDGEIPLNLAVGDLMICGQDGCINWVNQSFVDIYGLPDRTVALGTTFDSVYALTWSKPRNHAETARHGAGQKTLIENLRYIGAPFELPLPDNRFVRITASPTSDKAIFYAHSDISELKRQQRLLVEAEAAARRDGEKAYYLATHDTLTKLPNRMLCNERLRDSFLNLKRMRVVYSLLALDIDHFKLVNDAHGHAIGDQVLRALADELRNTVRESDFVARIGGEEFLVVLPATGLNEARLVAEKSGIRWRRWRVLRAKQSP